MFEASNGTHEQYLAEYIMAQNKAKVLVRKQGYWFEDDNPVARESLPQYLIDQLEHV